MNLSIKSVHQAEKHYQRWFNKTPIEYSKVLSDYLKTPVIFKLENMHPSGSYKLRCAHFSFSFLSEKDKKQEIALFSHGYFGLAYAYICFIHQVRCHVYVPSDINPLLKEKIVGYDAGIHIMTSEKKDEMAHLAEKEAHKKGYFFIRKGFNPENASVGGALVKEILEDIPQMTTLVMPTSCCGVLEGAKYYLSHLDPGYHLIACDLETNKKISKKNQGYQRYDSIQLVSRKESQQAIEWLIHHHQILIDEDGATTLAYLLKKKELKLEGPICVVLSGRYLNRQLLS